MKKKKNDKIKKVGPNVERLWSDLGEHDFVSQFYIGKEEIVNY